MNSVLLHLRDPALAIMKAAAVAQESIIITDVSETQFLGAEPDLQQRLCLHFIPRYSSGGPADAWWYIPSTWISEYLKILGFPSVSLSFHEQKFMDGAKWKFYTIVGHRGIREQ
jgi:hypothetical protein